MSTIAEIIRQGHGRAGSNGAWRVEADSDNDPFDGTYYNLWHYGVRMLRWHESRRYGVEAVDWDIGNGSVSDQGGMNTAFRVLGLPFYYSRAGGAEIIELCTCSRFDFPHQSAPACAERIRYDRCDR